MVALRVCYGLKSIAHRPTYGLTVPFKDVENQEKDQSIENLERNRALVIREDVNHDHGDRGERKAKF